jgi:hypothetical protein
MTDWRDFSTRTPTGARSAERNTGLRNAGLRETPG